MHYLQHILILLLLALMPFASTAQENKEDGTPAAIPPLLGGRVWGQKAPFNNQCPKFNSDKRPPTGCVATAMAQIMAHHKHPLKGVKDVSYRLPTMNEYLPTFIKNQTYDWENMLDSYNEGTAYTSTQSHAVARLMYHAGVCVYTDYTHEVSTAFDTEAVRAMVENFLYDDEIRLIRRSDHSSHEWEEVIQKNLREGKPVYYSGSDSDKQDRHTFVIDGMDKEGRYHVNWGWNGTHNGYYHLDALMPEGNSIRDYSHHAHAIVNIHPADSIADKTNANMGATPINLTINSDKIRRNENMTLCISMLKNLHHLNFSGEIQPYLTNETGNFLTSIGLPFKAYLPAGNVHNNTIEMTFNIPDSIPDGTYRLYAGIRQGSYRTWDYVRGQRGDNPSRYHYYTIHIKNDSLITDNVFTSFASNPSKENWVSLRTIKNTLLHVTSHSDIKRWQIVSSQGRLFDQGKENSPTLLIDIRHYPTGIYLLQGFGKEGQSYTIKFLKQ